MCSAGERPGGDQAVLPRGRQRAEDVVREQVARAEVVAARSLPVHPDHRRPHQELCLLANQPRSLHHYLSVFHHIPTTIITTNDINVPVVLVKGKGTTPYSEKRGKEKNVSFHPQKSENSS